MEYRLLGNSGLKVSLAGLGGSSFGNRCDAPETAAIINRALDLGINFIDTADVYNGGLSEEYIGRAICSRRADVVLATKFDRPTGSGPLQSGASGRYVRHAVQNSLRRLKTDYIDLYQIHYWDPMTPVEETLHALNNLVIRGDICYIGCSNFAAWQIVEAQWTARHRCLTSLISAQELYNLLDRGIEKEVVPVCTKYGLGVIPYFPLAAGFLTGRYQRGSVPDPTARLARAQVAGSPAADRMLNDVQFSKLAKLENFARARGRSVRELALAWLASQTFVATIVIGSTTVDQIEENIRCLEWRLTDAELCDLDRSLEATTDSKIDGGESFHGVGA